MQGCLIYPKIQGRSFLLLSLCCTKLKLKHKALSKPVKHSLVAQLRGSGAYGVSLAVLCNAILPHLLSVSFDCRRKHRYFPEETAIRWRQRVKTVMAGVKLVLFIQTCEETQIMSNYRRHKSICVGLVEPLFNIHVRFWVSFPSSPCFFSTLWDALSGRWEWHCMANRRFTTLG